MIRWTTLAAVLVLSACGGGGSDVTATSTAIATGPLAKYEGVWGPGCNNHHSRETYTFASSSNGSALSVTFKEVFFANSDCTGAVVATAVYDKPNSTMQYVDSTPNASVTLLTGVTVIATVDRVTGAQPAATLTYSGSGVTSTYVSGGITYAHIAFSDGSTDASSRPRTDAIVQLALLLGNGELSLLLPNGNSSTSFQVTDRFIH